MNTSKLKAKYASLALHYAGTMLLLLFFMSEAVDKIIRKTSDDPVILAKSIKAIVFVVMFGLLIRSNVKKILLFVALPLVIFCLGQLFLGSTPNEDVILTLFKYLFPILLYLFFNEILKSGTNQKALFAVFEWIIFLNSIIIIGAFLLDIKWLSTYRFSRFGYNGLIYASAASTYVYIIALYYFLIKILHKKASGRDYTMAIVVLLATFLIGTKTLYLGIFFILSLLFWKVCNPRYRKWLIAMVILLLIFGGYYFFYGATFFGKITKKEGFLTSLLSYRNILFETRTFPFIADNWNFGNFLFGGISDIKTRSQMSIVDVFYFWGFIGGVVYLFLYLKSYFRHKLSVTDWAFFIFTACITILAGNFFLYATIPLYLLILRERIRFEQSQKTLPKE